MSNNANGMNRAVEIGLPKGQEPVQFRIIGGGIDFLPNETLKNARVVRHLIKDFSRGQMKFSRDHVHGAYFRRFIRGGPNPDGRQLLNRISL